MGGESNHGWVKELMSAGLRGLQTLDPDAVPIDEVADLISRFTTIERIGAIGRTLVARRAAEAQLHRQAGEKTAAEWLARLMGAPVGKAIDELTTSEAVGDQPEVDAAARNGELSEAQLNDIADAAKANPKATKRLIGSAKRNGYRKQQEECRRAKAEGQSEDEKRAAEERVRKNRRCRTYVGHDGAGGLDVLGPADEVKTILAGLERYKRAAFDAARRAGRRESDEAYRFDALVALARDAMEAFSSCEPVDPVVAGDEGPATTLIEKHRRAQRPLPKQRVHVVIPAEMLLPDGGEATIELIGVGPISMAKALDLLPQAVWDVVITKGIDIAHYTHLGRHPTMAQQVAVLLRSRGRCEHDGCDRLWDEIDHEPPWEQTKHTRLDELNGTCRTDHRIKTRRQQAERRARGPGP